MQCIAAFPPVVPHMPRATKLPLRRDVPPADVVFWANGYTERLEPYWWAGPSVSTTVGDLASVNVTD